MLTIWQQVQSRCFHRLSYYISHFFIRVTKKKSQQYILHNMIKGINNHRKVYYQIPHFHVVAISKLRGKYDYTARGEH